MNKERVGVREATREDEVTEEVAEDRRWKSMIYRFLNWVISPV